MITLGFVDFTLISHRISCEISERLEVWAGVVWF